MTTCPPERAPLLAVTVAPAWAWATAVRNTPVLNVPHLPPSAAPGCYVAVCASEGRDDRLVAWMERPGGVRAPPMAELHERAVVTVGRLVAVSQGPVGAREHRWYRGPVGLWLEDVVPLPEAVPCELRAEGEVWHLPEDVLTRVREGYGSVLAEDRARWDAYQALAERAGAPIERLGLRGRVLQLCPTCRRAMAPCRPCSGWRCTTPSCAPHACAAEARP